MILIVLSCWTILTGVGWLVLAPLKRTTRDALLPTAPLFGVALLVVVLHDTTLVLSVRWGIGGVALVLAGLVVVAFRRDRKWWRPDRRAVAALAMTAACGVVPALWALGPALAVGDSGVVQPSGNNDAFYYVSVTDWLQDHPATDVPTAASTPEEDGQPPSFNSARAQLTLDLRIGQELTHAALTTVLGLDGEQTWYPVTALWMLILPASGVAAARSLRLHLVTGLLLGTALSVSALVVFQFAAQNSDSLLGTALVPLALGTVLRALGRDPLVPRLLAGVSLAALVGTYTEFVPLVAPALVAAVLLRRPSEIGDALRSALLVVLAAVLAAPLIWIRAVRSLLFLGGMPSDSLPTSFAGAPIDVIVGRFLGVIGPSSTTVSVPLVIAIGAFVLAGLVAAVVLSGRRWFYLALLAMGLFLAVYLVAVRDRSYTQQRVVQLFLPLVLIVVAVGWDQLCRLSRRSRDSDRGRRKSRPASKRLPAVVAGIAVVGALGFIATNSRVDHEMDLPGQARSRHVDPSFEEAAGWVDTMGGQHGDQTLVMVGDFFTQLWITDALRTSTEVAYPTLHVSYQGQTSYWDGRPRRWLLVDRTSVLKLDRGMVVRRNSRFALIDLSRGRAAVATPADVFGQNSFLVLRSEVGPRTVDLIGTQRDRAPTDVPPNDGYGTVLGEQKVPGRIGVDLQDRLSERVVLSDESDVFVLDRVGFGKPRGVRHPVTNVGG